MSRKTIASLLALGLLLAAETVQAQNRLVNPSFEQNNVNSGLTSVFSIAPWTGGSALGVNYWQGGSRNGNSAVLLQGNSIFQSGSLSNWSVGTNLLVFDCAGYRGRTDTTDVPVDVAMWGLKSGASSTFSVYTKPNTLTHSPLNNLAAPKTFAWPFTFWNSGNGSSTLQISTNDPEGVVVDNTYLLNLDPTVSPKTPAAFSAVNGCAYSGTLANLWNSDANPITIFSAPTTDAAGMLVATISPTAAPTKLSVGFRMARATVSPDVEYQMYLYDFVNKGWTNCSTSSLVFVIGPFVGTTQQTATLNGNASLSRFVGPNNVVLARIAWDSYTTMQSSTTWVNYPFKVMVDQVIFTIQ